jgi:2-polyprenyl-3-methyl-5-hydroxy-6-metoxy-1,4-benzoquinol methylase
MPLLSQIAAAKKMAYFLRGVPPSAAILEIGSGSGWAGQYLKQQGWNNYKGLDLAPPADIVGDIRQWKALGISPESFDVILAFELVEHVECFDVCYALLKPGGKLMVTTPVPHMDWAMKLLETIGLNQKRTSPHDHLVYLKHAPYFERKEIRTVACLAQWGILIKQPDPCPL